MTDTIAITPDAMRDLARTVAACGAAVGHAAAAVRSAPTLASTSAVAGGLAVFHAAWSSVLAAVADDTAICSGKITAAADSWVVLDRHAGLACGRPQPCPTAS